MASRLRPMSRGAGAVAVLSAIIAMAVVTVYRGTLDAPFIFDDVQSIVENTTIRDLSAPGAVLGAAVPNGGPVLGRPFVNLTLAVNYALGGLDVRGYHLFNQAVHALAGFILFGLMRRTLAMRPGSSAAGGPGFSEWETQTLPAFFVALLWALHPLQSEAVICSVLRTESLMALFYLLTLYGVVRGATSVRPQGWYLMAVGACFAGMASKEVMVSAPLVALLYDRTFFAGTFREAWRRRWGLYVGLAASWLLLAGLIIDSGGRRGGTAGFGAGISSVDYLLTQCRAIVWYLRLTVWPDPLVADYGTAVVTRLGDVWPEALLLVCSVAGAVFALWRWPVWGFLGISFFAILAPSSSIVPVATQTMAEHRMYLPLAVLTILGVIVLRRLTGRGVWIALLGIAVVFGAVSARRGEVYRDEVVYWREVLRQRPENPRAHFNVGCLLMKEKRDTEALREMEVAIRLQPNFTEAHVNLGHLLNRAGRATEAVARYECALRLRPAHTSAHSGIGMALARLGRIEEALTQLREAVRLRPESLAARLSLAEVLLAAGKTEDAAEAYRAVLGVDPENAAARHGLDRARAMADTTSMN